MAGGAGLVGRTIAHVGTRVAGRAAGLKPETVQAGIDDPSLLRAPAPDAELAQAQRLGAQLEAQRAEITPYHLAYESEFLGPHRDMRLNANRLAGMIRSKISGGVHPGERSADAVLRRMADDLEGIVREAPSRITLRPSVKPVRAAAPDMTEPFSVGERRRTVISGGITPEEMGGAVEPSGAPVYHGTLTRRDATTPQEMAPRDLYPEEVNLPPEPTITREVRTARTPTELGGATPDEITAGRLDKWISTNLTDPLKGAYARPGDAVLANRLKEIRGALAESLYESLGPGASPVQKLAGRAIRTREAVENVFDLGAEARPTGTAAERIRGILGESGEAQKNRAVLAAYDEEYGTRHLKDAQRLAMQQEWQGKDLSKAMMIDSVLQPTRPGFVQSIALPVARGGAKITRVAGPVTAGVTAGTQSERRKKKEKK
jgi:hypothetical protein